MRDVAKWANYWPARPGCCGPSAGPGDYACRRRVRCHLIVACHVSYNWQWLVGVGVTVREGREGAGGKGKKMEEGRGKKMEG